MDAFFGTVDAKPRGFDNTGVVSADWCDLPTTNGVNIASGMCPMRGGLGWVSREGEVVNKGEYGVLESEPSKEEARSSSQSPIRKVLALSRTPFSFEYMLWSSVPELLRVYRGDEMLDNESLMPSKGIKLNVCASSGSSKDIECCEVVSRSTNSPSSLWLAMG